LRFLYYDCAPYIGKTKLPVSGKVHEFKGNDGWLKQLASKDLFAVRRGVPSLHDEGSAFVIGGGDGAAFTSRVLEPA
jgi:hypothetical protein